MRNVMDQAKDRAGAAALTRTLTWFMALLVATAGGLAALAVPAQASIGVIRGTVTNAATGQPFAGVLVVPYQQESGSGEWSGLYENFMVRTDAAGAYSIYLPQGTYRVGFEWQLEGQFSPWYQRFYGGSTRDTATDVVVGSGATTSGVSVNVSPEPAGKISGLATTSQGAPAVHANVQAYRTNVEDGNNPYSAVTGPDGRYVLGLEPGTYRVCFPSTRAQGNSSTACPETGPGVHPGVVVQANQTTTVDDGQTAQQGSITGTITDAAGNPIPNFNVTLFAWDSADGGYGSGSARTNAQGVYRLFAPDGEWSVGYGSTNSANTSGNEGNPHYNQYFPKWEGPFTINSSAVLTGFDAQLDRIGGISGTVVDENGFPFPGARLLTYRRNTATGEWEPWGQSVWTDQAGYYQGHHEDGSYRLCAVKYDPVLSDLVTTSCYGGGTVDTATDFTITAPNLLTGRNIVVPDDASTPDPLPTSTPTPTPTPSPTPTPPAVPTPTPTPPSEAAIRAAIASALSDAKVAGRATVGKTVRLKGLTTSLELRTGVTYKFQWLAGKKAIKKATKQKFVITRALRGKKISVKVTATSMSVTASKTLKVGKVT